MPAKPSEIFWGAIYWYQVAKLKQQIPFWVVLAIAIYIPFEEFILRWIPAPALIILFLRFLHEIVLYYFGARVFYKRLVKREHLIKSPVELAFICFLLWAIILLIVQPASIFGGLNNLRTFIRYITVYYIIVDLNLSKQQIGLLLKTIFILGLIQGYLVAIQYFAPPSFNDLFVPRNVNLEAGGIAIQKSSEVAAGVLKTGAVNGTFANTANTSAFLLFCFITIVVFILRPANSFLGKILSFLIMYFAFFATFKRIALFFGLFVPIIVLFFSGKKLWVGKITWLYLFGLFLMIFSSLFFLNVDTSVDGWAVRTGADIDLLGYFGQLFTPEYWNKGTRQWIIKTIFQGTIATGNWFGFSPDEGQAIRALAEVIPRQGSLILERQFWFEDVYWAAMLLYYGIPGVALFGYIINRLYRTSKWLINYSLEIQYRQLGIIFCTLSVITIFYGFVERIFEIKAFSFYYWLLAGAVVNVYSRYWQKIER